MKIKVHNRSVYQGNQSTHYCNGILEFFFQQKSTTNSQRWISSNSFVSLLIHSKKTKKKKKHQWLQQQWWHPPLSFDAAVSRRPGMQLWEAIGKVILIIKFWHLTAHAAVNGWVSSWPQNALWAFFSICGRSAPEESSLCRYAVSNVYEN